MKYVIGVDGGGTKTLGAIAGQDGVPISMHEVGSSNHHSNPMDVVRTNLGNLINTLLANANVKPADVSCICLGMAGVDRPEDRPMVEGLIKEFLPTSKCIPVNDGVIALVGGAMKPFGIIAISGTGSIAFGMNEQGDRVRAGGWGHVLGDEGSGYKISLSALQAICKAWDNRIPPTKLTDIVLEHLKLERAPQLLGWIKGIEWSKAVIGGLSRLVYEAYEKGDAAARGILIEQASDLAGQVYAVAQKLFNGRGGYNVVVGGGNLRKSDAYFGIFREQVDKVLPSIPVIRPQKEPVEGAVLYALQQQ